jgi:hypothetical protein
MKIPKAAADFQNDSGVTIWVAWRLAVWLSKPTSDSTHSLA